MGVIRVWCLSLKVLFFLSFQWCEISYGNGLLPTVHEYLIDKYNKIEKELNKSAFDIPFYLESSISKNTFHVDIYGSINYTFNLVIPHSLLRDYL